MRIVIAGGGLAAARAAESARESGFDGAITIVSEERHLPYHRPPLSKDVLVDDPGVEPWILPAAYYTAHEIALVHARAVSLDLATRRVGLDTGRQLTFDRLLVATGSVPRRLDVPGADLHGVHTLRTLDDATRIAHWLDVAEDVVVVGAGLIGLEVASAARARGLRVTVVDPAATPLARMVGPRLGEIVGHLHHEAGVDLRLRTGVRQLLGERRVAAVELTDGSRIAAQLVVVGIGVRPATDWLVGTGVDLDDGVVVDGALASNVPGVFAAGDVARTWSPRLGRHLRVEHDGHAHLQGIAAGRSLAGAPVDFVPAPGASSTQHGRRIQVAGWVRGDEEVLFQGRLDERLTAFYVRDGRITAAASIDGGRDFLLAKRLVAAEAPADQIPGGPS